MSEDSKTKKALILDTAREIKVEKWTPAEIDQLRRRLLAEHGEAGKTGSDYIAEVLKDAGHRVLLTLQEEAEEQYEEEFEDLLHFKTLEDAEVSVMRLDELMRKFRSQGEHAAVERVLNVARLGKRRQNIWNRKWSPTNAKKWNRELVSHLAPTRSSTGSSAQTLPEFRANFPKRKPGHQNEARPGGPFRVRALPFCWMSCWTGRRRKSGGTRTLGNRESSQYTARKPLKSGPRFSLH
jgi:hypothetical protein